MARSNPTTLIKLGAVEFAPARADWRLIAISGSLQMAAFSVLCNVALMQLLPGRASVLAYCTPLWVGMTLIGAGIYACTSINEPRDPP